MMQAATAELKATVHFAAERIEAGCSELSAAQIDELFAQMQHSDLSRNKDYDTLALRRAVLSDPANQKTQHLYTTALARRVAEAVAQINECHPNISRSEVASLLDAMVKSDLAGSAEYSQLCRYASAHQ